LDAGGDHFETVARSPRIWLLLQPGQQTERAVEIAGERAVIGRGEDCDLVLEDPTVSRHHAVISMRLGSPALIEDLDSDNGTYVNGKRIRSPIGFSTTQEHPKAELRGGEWLQIGNTIAIVSLLPPNLVDPKQSQQ
jgi:pSer/pThr/pTyr-binding forkhead associated (FHA) protein